MSVKNDIQKCASECLFVLKEQDIELRRLSNKLCFDVEENLLLPEELETLKKELSKIEETLKTTLYLLSEL